VGNLQVKAVPDRLHDEIRRRAAKRHQTVRDFVLELIERELERPSWEEWLAEAADVTPAGRTIDVVAAVRTTRQKRAAELRRARRR